MAVLLHFPILTSLLTSHKLLLSSSVQLTSFHFHSRHHSCSRISASSKRPRKAKENAELCNEIKEFLSSVGLPENHVPSMKELSQNGRQDLANIVRRRGYKFIRQLLDESNTPGLNDNHQNGQLELSVSEGPNENLEVLSDGIGIWSWESIQAAGAHNGAVTCEPSTSSLKEKVAKFIEHGELDAAEEYGLEIGHTDELDWNSELENADKPKHASSNPQQSAPPSLPKIERPVFEEQTSDDKYLDSEARKLENQAEIERLKSLLDQKETELVQLKQQIEKENLSLSVLQTEAKTEISRAQELISEKNTQVQAAEESLSDLKEVEILYSGGQKAVELAGSFNGWHETIRMELQTPLDASASLVWRAVLWLYPGVYEIKFVVDGEWIIDARRETITRHSIQNNILRVDK